MSNGVQVITLRVPSKLADEVRTLAARMKTSINHEGVTALRAHVDASKKGAGK